MDIGKSTRIALAQRDKSSSWLAELLGVTRQQISSIRKSTTANSSTIEKLAAAFELKASEFIALSED